MRIENKGSARPFIENMIGLCSQSFVLKLKVSECVLLRFAWFENERFVNSNDSQSDDRERK